MKKFNVLYIICIALLFTACKKPFTPEVTSININYLVVEGFINTGLDSTIIRLSRTVLVDEKSVIKPELGAIVNVENESNTVFPLKDLGKGMYVAVALNLDASKKYRLRVKTSKGVVYLSDFVEVKVSPPIDEISFEAKTDGLQLAVSTHDDSDKSRYYRWEYVETYEFHANYFSLLRSTGTAIVDRKLPEESVFTCYKTTNSSNIILGSTVKLAKDVVAKAPIEFIEQTDERVSVRYSTLVKQYVLTKEAYEFWERLKKNTESLGTIFDAQPSELTGNIHNAADSSEPVLGFIGAGTTQVKRFFVDKAQLPNWTTKYPFMCYAPDTVNTPAYIQKILKNEITALMKVTVNNIPYTLVVSKECGDCTIRGVNVKPSFW